MQNLKHIIVGTAGHIDHGKSSLILAVTGTDPDRWAEEKRRGITIDLGFAFLDIGEVRIGFVDVPGHERFVRNMLAGVGGIDLVLLVVAADESIKPQTREHFEICKLLGISRGIVVLTKSDLVDADVLGLTRLEVEDFLRGSFLEGAPMVAVSSRTGAGLDPLKENLLRLGADVPAKDPKQNLRLPVDRSFAMKGFGTVVTGTLVSGMLKVEDEVEVYPGGRRLRVRGLHSGGKQIQQAVAGQRAAVNLAGVEHGEIKRGTVLAPAGFFAATTRVDARITLLGSAKALKNRARIHFHQGTVETSAEVIFLEAKTALGPGEAGLAQLVLKEPVFLLPGDRFIVRQLSPVETIGGGVVLDAHAGRHRQNDRTVASYLAALESGNRESILGAMLERSSRGLTSGEILLRTGWTAGEIEAVAAKLATAKRARMVAQQPVMLAAAQILSECAATLSKVVEEFHKANPLLPGIPKQDLLGRFGHSRAEVVEAALADLVQAKKLALAGDLVRNAGREVALSADEAEAKNLIAREFETAGLAVPGFAAVLEKLPVDAGRAQKILQILVREKVLVKITGDLIFHQTALVRLRELLAKYRKEHGDQLPIAAFKELTGVSRKYAIPLLEHLDRERLTRRVGDQRVIM
ncbi:MAG TPA: selenocysteine-specific translation elongation factor [Candidatus Acidoferrales bacterium]